MSGRDLLDEFILENASKKTEFGQNDCGLFLANWHLRKYGIDPCTELRGTYGSEESGMELVVDQGFFGFIIDIFTRVGMTRTNVPSRGDIGGFLVRELACVGIWTGNAFAMKSVTGVHIFKKTTALWALHKS